MRNMWRLFVGDLKCMFANAISVIIAVGLVVMPSIFAWYNIIACWDVFDNTGNLTVAVASADEGYESDLVPLRVNVGEQVVSALRANDQIDWTFTTVDDAIDGAKAGRYYAAVVIPESFSRDMLTFYTEDVERADIVYYANEKKSAIAPKITNQGADAVSYQVNEVFTETITEISLSLAESLSTYADNEDAGGRIAALAQRMRSLSGDVDDAASLLELYAQLSTSARTLVGDSAKLVESAQAELGAMSGAASEGMSSVEPAADAVRQAAADLSAALDESAQSFGAVENSVDALFDAALSGSAECASQMRTQADAVDAQITIYRQFVSQLEQLRDAAPAELAPAIDGVIAQVNNTITQMETMRDALRSAADKLEAGNADVQAERERARALAMEAQQGISALKADFDNDIRPGLQTIADDAASLASRLGADLQRVEQAGSSLAGAAGSVDSLLSNTTDKLCAATDKLRDVSSTFSTLADDIDAALASGDVDALKAVLGSDVQSLSKALAAPVGLERTAVFAVENFGSAMAPLYTTLALFIGSLLILVALKPKPGAKVVRTLDNPKPRQLFLGHFGVMAVLSLMQSTLMGLGNMLFLQVQVSDPVLFMVCFWGAGFVFAFIIYALVASFANLGKAIAVLLLIVQVTGCGGSYPLPILPGFIQAISPYLPATHVVNAMREAMLGVSGTTFWTEMGLLALFLIPAALLGLLLRKPLASFMEWFVEQVESSKLVG